MNRKPARKIIVWNFIRCAVFALLYIELFMLNCWLVPAAFQWLTTLLILGTLPVGYFIPAIRGFVAEQIFDRVKLRSQFVEFDSGVFGETWDRPYSEFRIQCKPFGIGPMRIYLVRLRHRVLGNSLLKVSFYKDTAESATKGIVDNSQLGFTRSG